MTCLGTAVDFVEQIIFVQSGINRTFLKDVFRFLYRVCYN